MKHTIKLIIPAILALSIISVNAHAGEIYSRSVESTTGKSQIIRLKPEYKDPVIPEEPVSKMKSYEESTNTERFETMNSFCAGYYGSKSIGEMGTISSLAGLVFKNSFSSKQKLAVRLFTEHSNAYKRQGGIIQEAYDLGGRLGGQIWMSGQAQEGGETFTEEEMEQTCSTLRKGILP